MQALVQPEMRALSEAQLGIWVAQMLDPQSGVYNIAETIEIQGAIEPALLCTAASRIIATSDALHLRFIDTPDGPRQFVEPAPSWRPPFVDLSTDPDAETKVMAWIQNDLDSVVDLEHGPLFMLALFRLAPDRHVMYARSHHICNDGFGAAIFIERVADLYTAMVEGIGDDAGPCDSWADLMDDEAAYRASPRYEKDRAYWLQCMADCPPPVTLSGHVPGRPASIVEVRGTIARPVADVLQKIGAPHGASLPQMLIAAAACYLHRLTESTDIVLGIPVTARTGARMRGIVGMVANVLPLRLQLHGHETMAGLATQVTRRMRELLRHQRYRREALRQDLGLGADHPEIYGTVVNVNSFSYDVRFGGQPCVVHNVGSRPVNDLQLVVFDNLDANDISIKLFGKAGHYSLAELRAHLDRFLALVAGWCAGDADMRVGDLDVIGAQERYALLEQHNATGCAVLDATLASLFEAQAARAPSALAVTGLDGNGQRQCLSYGQLNARANALAHYLLGQGIAPGMRVGVCMERSVDLVVALLAVVKTGAAYVPMEPDLPAARIAFICRDTGAALLLTGLDADGRLAAQPETNPGVAIDPDYLAYVIYTSGSTGTPKGVALQHRPVVNLIDWVNRRYGVGARDRLLFVTSPSFDLSVYDLFGSFAAGASIHVASAAQLKDPAALLEAVYSEAITFWDSAPAFLQQMTPFLPADGRRASRLRLAFVSGDWIPVSLPDRLRQAFPALQVVGLGGATEAAIWSNSFDIGAVDAGWASIPYGLPIQNARYYILDARCKPVPFGVAGDLYIGGDCLAYGYYARPRLTAERFVPDPYAGRPGARMYATGDRARRHADGNIEFLGRLDQQVKVRGFRIELGEIQAALQAHASVGEALVMVREIDNENQLLAYVTTRLDPRDEALARNAHCDQWRQSFDQTYAEGRAGDLNLAGWNSSYTGAPIPEADMSIWVEQTVAAIRALEAKQVLEIGCGTGLLLTRLYRSCDRYIGLDFSATVLAQLGAYLGGACASGQLELVQGYADQLSFLEDDSVDLVILNSVVQYFPDIDYFLKVHAEALRVVRPGGHVFIGDVRSLALLEACHLSFQLFRADDAMPVPELRERVREAVANEEELLIAPALFACLGERSDKIAWIDTAPKAGAYDNELSRFRYDVTIHVGDRMAMREPDVQVAWDDGGAWLLALAAALKNDPRVSALVTGIPDARVAPFARMARMMHAADGAGTAGELKALAPHGEDVNTVIAFARQRGATLCWRGLGADGTCEAILNCQLVPPAPGIAAPSTGALERFANVPCTRIAAGDVGRVLDEYLRRRLPDYMVPASIMTIPAWPLSANGKVELAALPQPERRTRTFCAPRTHQEHTLCQLFSSVLHASPVGIDDDFFALGGHSLSAARLTQKVGMALGVDLTIRALFEAPTVRQLAARLSLVCAPAASFDTVLPIRARGTLPPLFCIHPVGGLSWSYAGLINGIDHDRPLYGLQARGILDAASGVGGIEDMAREYIAAIRKIQPEGPYHLLGWSFGGLVAHAMAEQLHAAQAPIGLLALLDSYPMGPDDVMPAWNEAEVLAGIAKALAIGTLDPATPGVEALLAAARRAGHVLGCLDVEQGTRFVALLEDFRRFVPAFRPGRSPGDMLFFAATQAEAVGIQWAGAIAPSVWAPHVAGRIHVRAIACAHTEMGSPGPLEEIGRKIEYYLHTAHVSRSQAEVALAELSQ